MIKNILFDLDGTIYNGTEPISGLENFFLFLESKKINYFFVSNNSSISKEKYFEKLRKFNIKVAKNQIYSSIDITKEFLIKNKAKNIYVVGTKELSRELSKVVSVQKKYNKEVKVDFVVVGFDKELTYKKIEEASLYIQNGAKLVSTNPDINCPIEGEKKIPDCGSITLLFEKSLKIKTKYLGKPNPNIINLIIREKKLLKHETIIVGDRIYTDILCGKKARVKTVLVLTGETKKEDLTKSKIKPDIILDSVIDLKKII